MWPQVSWCVRPSQAVVQRSCRKTGFVHLIMPPEDSQCHRSLVGPESAA